MSGVQEDGRVERRFRKKPVEVEAVEWTGRNLVEIGQFVGEGIVVDAVEVGPPRLAIVTLEGEMFAAVGDWIIKGVEGEFYPCKPSVFAATYEHAAAAPVGDTPDLIAAAWRVIEAHNSEREWTAEEQGTEEGRAYDALLAALEAAPVGVSGRDDEATPSQAEDEARHAAYEDEEWHELPRFGPINNTKGSVAAFFTAGWDAHHEYVLAAARGGTEDTLRQALSEAGAYLIEKRYGAAYRTIHAAYHDEGPLTHPLPPEVDKLHSPAGGTEDRRLREALEAVVRASPHSSTFAVLQQVARAALGVPGDGGER